MRTRLLVALVAVAALAGACGFPTSATPSALSKNQVPYQLLSPHPPAPTTTSSPASVLVPVRIYLVGPNQNLAAVSRALVYPAPLEAVLTALLAGPTRAESSEGLTTAIPAPSHVLSASTAGSVVTVNFDKSFGNVSGPSQVLAVEQVVFTVAALLSATTGVQFEIAGAPIDVPVANGSVVTGPVYVLQFIALPPATTTTT